MKEKSFLYVLGIVIFVIMAILGAIAIQGVLIYFIWNWLLLFLIPTLPTLTFIQATVAGVVLSVFGAFFKTPLKYK